MSASFETLAIEIARVVVSKRARYGDSLGSCPEFLRLLYPAGIPVEAYDLVPFLTRVWDKLARVVQQSRVGGDAEDARMDLVGYCLIEWARARESKGQEHG